MLFRVQVLADDQHPAFRKLQQYRRHTLFVVDGMNNLGREPADDLLRDDVLIAKRRSAVVLFAGMGLLMGMGAVGLAETMKWSGGTRRNLRDSLTLDTPAPL